MKAIFAAILLFVSTAVSALGADMTNGVFYVEKPVECHLISQNGSIKTNQLAAGHTYMVGDVLLEMTVANRTLFYFAGGPLLEAGSNSVFSIDSFMVEVKNLNDQPRKVNLGTRNLALTFKSGEFSIVYPNTDPNSPLAVTTDFAMYEFPGGKYFVRAEANNSMAYVSKGTMITHANKQATKTEEGKASVSSANYTFYDGLPNNPEYIAKCIASTDDTEKRFDDVQFFVVGGNVIGIWMK